MKLLFIFFIFLLLSCGQGNNRVEKEQKAKDSVNTNLVEPSENLNKDEWEAPAVVQEKNPLEISILNLYKSMEDKDEQEFLRQFPKDFKQFQSYFGWDTPNDAPHELYEHSVHYIEYLFYLLRTNKYPEYENNILSICENGQWEEDGVNYFQNHVLNHIKENEKYYLIDELDDTRAKSVLFFLFDGPHPKFDDDFASHLNTPKKQILEDLFETGFFDDNENPDPFPDDQTNSTYTLSDYMENEHFFIRNIDINNDGVLDKIVSAGPYQGDELLLFTNDGEEFHFTLKTTNFSEDGGNQIVDVVVEQDGFFIKTAFPDRGLNEAYHHIIFKDNSWILTNSVYRTQNSNQKDAFIYVCDVDQGLNMADTHFFEKLKRMPNEVERDTICTKEML
ncbi:MULTISPECIES: hypothetical protein [Flavobacteriaceae]|uniref:hypothetical protein n=1 Tax=Flavobacteriaceae TaxID=49546 RepID=UPI00234BDB62|nr:hypothetical protein [Muricauda sp. SP22]MDC6363779.1 hypothetical protein [Muricauda sp. SP22]